MSRVRLTPSASAESDRLVNRLKNTNLDKFHTLCKMHLSFLLHLPGTHLEEILGGGATPGTPGAGGPTSMTAERGRIFWHHWRRKHSKETISPASISVGKGTIDQIRPLVDYLSLEKNLQQEGLFRKSGHIGRQKLLREKLQHGEDIHLELEQAVYSAHDCANVLKSCLSDLPEPILTEKLYSAYCQVSQMEQPHKQLQTIQLLLQLLPAENLFLLKSLLTLLNKATREESSNKMTSETLGTLFAPHLLVPRKMSGSELQQAVAANLNKTVAFMIESVPEIFKIPAVLLADIATYWSQMEELSDAESETPPHGGACTPDTPRIRYRRRVDPSDIPISTAITFADRDASQRAAETTDTRMELLQLYAHVASMPESAKKRKLISKFNKSNDIALAKSPAPSLNRHKRTRSVGDSIKKLVGKNQKSQTCRIEQPNLDDSAISYKTPVARQTTKSSTLRPNPAVKLFSKENIMPSPVHIVDMKENSDPQLLQVRKRKSPFNEPSVPNTPKCTALYLSPLRDFPIPEEATLDHTPFVSNNTKEQILAINHTRQTV